LPCRCLERDGTESQDLGIGLGRICLHDNDAVAGHDADVHWPDTARERYEIVDARWRERESRVPGYERTFSGTSTDAMPRCAARTVVSGAAQQYRREASVA
jgi:hypothetical protein